MPPSVQDQLESALGAAYAIERELGGGGMSRVFVATETALGRKVVIKVLPPDVGVSLSAERFQQEARLTANMQHPHIVPVLSAGRAGDLLYYTMPFVRGESLREKILARGPLPIAEAESVIRDVLRALSYAHRQGVVHRDIKPDNILLTDDGALVTDFGIAKATSVANSQGGAAAPLTGTGVSLGTLNYMAPEQLAADPTADHRVDLFATGLVMYECLTGSLPFASLSPQMRLAAQISQDPTRVQKVRADVPARIALFVERCLEKERERRPASAEAALALLDAAGAGSNLRLRGAAAVLLLGIIAGGTWAATGPLRIQLNTVRRIMARPDATLHDRRILVAPFAASPDTGQMQALGGMIADFVAQGLSSLPNVEVVDSRTAMITAEVVDRIPKMLRTGDNAVALAEEVGAGVLITGRVYQLGDSVRVDAMVIDSRTRSVRVPLGSTTVPSSKATSLVEWVRRRAVAAVTQATDTSLVTAGFGAGSTPPSLEAYRLLITGIKQVVAWDSMSNPTLRAATAMDTTWILPRLFLALATANERHFAVAESTLVALRPLMDRATGAERAMHATMDAYFRLDRPGAFAASMELMRLAPAAESQLLAVSYAMYDGRLRQALEILGEIDPDRGINLGTPFYWRNYAFTYLRLGENQKALEAARTGMRTIGVPAFYNIEIQALASLRAPLSEITSRFDRFSGRDSEPLRNKSALANMVAMRLLRAGAPEDARAFARHAVSTTPASADRNRLAVFLGDSAAARELLRTLRADSAAARSLRPFETGGHAYRLAGIAMLTGDRERAIRHLSEAKARSHPFYAIEGFMPHLDPLFFSLHGYAPFEALVAEKDR